VPKKGVAKSKKIKKKLETPKGGKSKLSGFFGKKCMLLSHKGKMSRVCSPLASTYLCPLPRTPAPHLFLALIVYSFFFLTVELYQKFY